ncbi:type II secretion system secretin GspD [Halioxenophilus aromaticivorans]|uniref:GspD family T2SS secretin variant XcpQ n=1 Tax=Halioxenophilus aromaticivorans TaxID=1306992 RepID=A0AAV3U679_9ALTE
MRALLLAALILGTSPVFAQNDRETLTLNFNDADVVEVIRYVGAQTGKTIVIDPRVKGQVQVFTNGEVTRDEAYSLLLSILEIHGFTAYESNGVVRVVPNKDVRSSPIPVTKSSSAAAGDQYVTEVIALRNVSAAKVLPVLRPLVAQHAHMAAYDPSNSIVISDTAANIARVKQVIAQIDGAAMDHTEVIELQHAPVDDAVKMLETLMGSEGGSGAGSLKMVPDARTNSILVSGDELQRSRIRGLVDRLDRPQAQTGNVRVIYLEYANATEVAQTLSKLVQNIEKNGEKAGQRKASVEADEATNALLITAEGDTLDSLLQVVERLDIRRAQVLVEAVIAEMTDTDGKELGIEWLFADQDGGFGANNNGTIGAAANSIFSDDSDVLADLAGDLSSVTGTLLGVADFDTDKGFVGLVTALQQRDNANILSTPSILTTDNHEAEILVGQEIPVATGSYNNTEGVVSAAFNTYERQPVGVTLRVTPSINEGDRIILDIEQEVSSLSGQNNNGEYITNERSLNTQVLANDGQVVILGGLMRDDVQTSMTKIPLLGSIPLLGRLFRSTDDSVTKTNLMVFIRASVIRDDETLTGTTAEKYKFLREKQLERRNAKGVTINRKLLPVVPQWPIAKSDDLSGYSEYLRNLEEKRAKKNGKKTDEVMEEIRAINNEAEAKAEAREDAATSGVEDSGVIDLTETQQ